MIVVNTNPTSLIAQNNLTQSTYDMTQAINRLSSGYRVNTAADDPAGLAVASPLQSRVAGLYQASRNAVESTNVADIADSTLSVVQDNLTRIRQVAVQAANGIYNKQERANLQLEVDQLSQEISRLIKTTNYNGYQLFSSKKEQFTFQIGPDGDGKLNDTGSKRVNKKDVIGRDGSYSTKYKVINGENLRKSAPRPAKNAGNAITVTFDTLTSKGRGNKAGGSVPLNGKDKGLQTYNKNLDAVNHVDVRTQSAARASIRKATHDIELVTKSRAQFGALSNRFKYVERTNNAVSQASESSISRIMDADYALESSNYAAAQIRQQAGAAVLAQANAMPQVALTLLR